MRMQTSAGAITAGLCLLLALASSGATSATTRTSRALAAPAGRGEYGLRTPQQRRRSGSTPSPCQTSYPEVSFVAIPNSADIAGGEDSSVLGGYGNVTCDADDGIGAGYQNSIDSAHNFNADDSFIGGGDNNQIGQTAAFVGAGSENFAGAIYSAIAGGQNNTTGANDDFVGGGESNSTSAMDAFVGAGDGNAAGANDTFVGAGNDNVIGPAAIDSVISGGYANSMTGQKATLGGGEQNDVTGSFATIPGGYRNEALGNESFAAGSQAEARYTGSFVWSDYVSSEKPMADSRPGEFVARASGGVYFFSNAASSTGVHLAAGSGTWSSLSDRNAKTGIVPLDDEAVLAKVGSLPVSAWQYTAERGVRHVGPMAQDFYAAFGVGEDDRHITSIDEDGVALAAIKALRSENLRLQSRLAKIEARDADLALRFDRLLTRDARRR